MNIMITIHRNSLYINNKLLNFNHNIETVIIMESQVIILLNIPNDCDDIDNIYSVGIDAKVQWRIKSRSTLFDKYPKVPYVGIQLKDNMIVANDFCGIRYIIDSKNGCIVGRDTNGRNW